MAVDDNAVYLSGRFEDAMTAFGVQIKGTAKGTKDMFVLAINKSLTAYLWHAVIYGSTLDDRQSLIVRDGNVTLAGSFTNTLTMQGSQVTSEGKHDAFVITVKDGTLVAMSRFGGPNNEKVRDIAAAPNSGLLVTGQVQDPADNLTHLLLAKLDASGQVECTGTRGSDDGSQEGRAIGVTSTNKVFVIGLLQGSMSLVPGQILEGKSGRNAFLARFPLAVCNNP